jgi:hypothetical protein
MEPRGRSLLCWKFFSATARLCVPIPDCFWEAEMATNFQADFQKKIQAWDGTVQD